MSGKTLLDYQMKRAARESGPLSWRKVSRSVEVVVQADAHHVVGDVCAQNDRAEQRTHSYKSIIDRTVVHIEIFELCRPIAGYDTFDAAASGPAGPVGAEAIGQDAAGEGAASNGEGFVALDFAVGETARGVEQPSGTCQDADPSADRAEPGQLFLVDEGTGGRAWKDGNDATKAGDAGVARRCASLAAALDVSLEPDQPVVVGLPVVADLTTANHAVETGRRRGE